MPDIQKVIISSTVEDLQAHRSHARDACLMLDFWPKMMEYIGAVDASGLAASLALVDESDLYVGIFAQRYGTIPEGSDLSITEAEYQRAVERGIPRLLFIATDEHAANLPADASPEGTERMRQFRARLLKERVVAFFSSPEELRAKLVASLLKYRSPEPRQFSQPIADELTTLNRTIGKLTTEQYKILDFLRGHRRVSITGCAGSGKTLVAAEKAIRLDREGKQVLMLCHNPFLADYLRTLTSGTKVQVRDFSTWVTRLAGGLPAEDSGWTPYEEPTEQVLMTAFDHLLEQPAKYDAVIVDEGQDFREEWWLLVEAALSNPETGILYIFHDDNQTLSPRTLNYPVTDAPYSLSTNCRNGGRIFKLVREFHPDAPQNAADLEQMGTIHVDVFRFGEEIKLVSAAVRDALTQLSEDQLVVLTTEPDPIENSLLYSLEIELPQPWVWQDVLGVMIQNIGGHYDYTGALPQFSDALFPTSRDVQAVNEWALRVSKMRAAVEAGIPTPDRVRAVRWITTPRELNLPPRTSRRVLLAFFAEPNWADTLPIPDVVTLQPAAGSLGPGEIALSTVGSYKGLESDGVILFVRSPKDNLEANLYVGISRARYMLYLVIHPEATEALPFLPRNRAES